MWHRDDPYSPTCQTPLFRGTASLLLLPPPPGLAWNTQHPSCGLDTDASCNQRSKSTSFHLRGDLCWLFLLPTCPGAGVLTSIPPYPLRICSPTIYYIVGLPVFCAMKNGVPVWISWELRPGVPQPTASGGLSSLASLSRQIYLLIKTGSLGTPGTEKLSWKSTIPQVSSWCSVAAVLPKAMEGVSNLRAWEMCSHNTWKLFFLYWDLWKWE